MRGIVLVDDDGADAFDEIGLSEHANGNAVFHAHHVGEVGHRRAVGQLPHGDRAGQGRFAAQRRQFLGCPVATIGFEGGDHARDTVGGEQAVDIGAVLDNAGERGTGAMGLEGRADVGRVVGERRNGIGQRVRRQIMRGQPDRETFRPIEPRTRQPEEHPDLSRQARQIPAAPDIGEQADPGFGHGKARVFGGDTIGAGQRDPHAAAHRNAVHDAHSRLGISEQPVIHLIFGAEERARGDAIALHAVGQHADVAAGAEAPAFGVIEDDGFDRIVGFERGERFHDAEAHVGGKRVERLRSVEANAGNLALRCSDEVGGHA